MISDICQPSSVIPTHKKQVIDEHLPKNDFKQIRRSMENGLMNSVRFAMQMRKFYNHKKENKTSVISRLY